MSTEPEPAHKETATREKRKKPWQRLVLRKFDIRDVTSGGLDPKHHDNRNKFDMS